MHNFTIPENDIDIGKRLDLYLALKLPEYSRSLIKKTIEENKVLLNKAVCYKAGYKVRALDQIQFPKITLVDTTIKNLPKSSFDLEILFEDKDYLFINKPSGLIVHPTSAHQTNTLVNKLLDLYQELPTDNVLRPGIVHRLDKDTSGVIVIAKTPKALWWLSQQFADRKVTKDYLSIGLHQGGAFPYKEGQEVTFEGYLHRSSKDRKQYAVEQIRDGYQPKGRYSKSIFTIKQIITIDTEKKLVLSHIFPKTGRTHQIRVHQRALGFTIIRDEIYMSAKQKNWADNFFVTTRLLNRLYLHAHHIAFENYDGKLYSVTSPMPPEYKKLIQNAQKK